MQLSRRTMLTSMAAMAAIPSWCFAAEPRRTLLAYYSYTGNTRLVAEKLRAHVGAQLLEIKMADPYPSDIRKAAERSRYELETGTLPALLDDPSDVSDYDLILVGGPVWWNTVAAPIMSFLERTDFRGRSVGLFATYALNPSHYESNFAAQAHNASVLPGLMINEFDIASGRGSDAIVSWVSTPSIVPY
ncbi:flavodoxin [Rhizobium sp. RCC_161_2]|uniref:flavodoxin n=1 Tax=Rhizobium sp. RCC_161_2 TaxID=3239219 RepID=UPI00352591B0